MVEKLLSWAVNNVVVVLLLTCSLVAVGGYGFTHVNVEAYPDPSPAIIGVVALYPGASAEDVERQVVVPLEVALAGMPGLKYTRAKAMFGLAYLLNQFDYGIDFRDAQQVVLNRMAQVQLPKGVVPELTPASPIDEIYRYTLRSPQDALGRDIYTLYDLKALQDWTLERELRRIPRVAGVTGCGGLLKRYEICPDPDRLKEYGITLQQLEAAISSSNANVGGNMVVQGGNAQVVRGIGLIGGGEDPMIYAASNFTDPIEAAAYLRAEERRRISEIRQIVIAATNNVPIRVEHVVEGGPVRAEEELGRTGVVVGHHTRQGKNSYSHPIWDEKGQEVLTNGQRTVIDEDEKVQGIVLLRKGEQSLPTLQAVREKIRELNETPGLLLPGVKVEPYYNRTTLIDVTTETVHENLLVGMVLVTVILLMFLSNIRTALIVAINVPLALMFAFGVLYLRGRSANLLSIGAVDFGIIVDSTVIMVENIYRRMSSGDGTELPFKDRILRAACEVERSLVYSTLIMVCALLPLFTMQGPEGQIFGPMADTYAFALGGALLLALTTSPVLCVLLYKKLKPAKDNRLVRSLKRLVVWQLNWALDHRPFVLGCILVLVTTTLLILPFMGREFMPELEEGNMVVRGTFPVNIALDETARNALVARKIIMSFPEVQQVVSQIGRPDDGMDPSGAFEMQCFVPLKRPDRWPILPGRKSPRSKTELIDTMNEELSRNIIGVNWDFSQIIRDDVMESLSGVKGENSVKIFGPDLTELERLAGAVNRTLADVRGVFDPGVFRIKGQTNLTFPVDRAKCALWNVSVADVEDVIQTAVGGMPFSEMTEGEKKFDISLRWPEKLREDVDTILDIPVDVVKNTISGTEPGQQQTPVSGATVGLSALGTNRRMPSLTGNIYNAMLDSLSRVPRRRLRDLVTPVDETGRANAEGTFVQTGSSTINREQGKRLIAVRFGVRNRDLAGTVAEAQDKVAPLIKPPYRVTWSGEFQQMQEAERRMLAVVAVSMLLIFVLLYLAFYSLLDALLVCANVVAMSLGGIWALIATGLNFNISAAVGFISILGVAVMNGLLMVSSYNHARALGTPLRDAILQGTEKLVRPVTMTALAAILGLLPAALSTKIGSQSQRPLAIVVVGGMITTLILLNLVPFLYSYYGHRSPTKGASHISH